MASILRSKLSVPRFADAIHRERLRPLLLETIGKPITIVTAGAGYGKTTFIAQAAEQSGKKTIWIRLDRSDSDLLTFLRYLVGGIQQYVPDFGCEYLTRFTAIGSLKQEWESLLIQLLNELELNLTDDYLIVLDDYHLIKDDPLINASLQFLLNHLPSSLQLVLVGRTDCGLPLSGFRAMRQVVEISERDLCFTKQEMDRTLQQLFGLSLAAPELETLHRKTGGWIAGLVLLCHGIRNRKPWQEINTLLYQTGSIHRNIADYLDETIYQPQPLHLKEFLKKTSILGYLSADLCNALLGIQTAHDILTQLETSRLFTYQLDEQQDLFVYHHLFQAFLRTKCRQELSADGFKGLHARAGELWETEGEQEEALKHYLAAERYETACALLKRMSRSLVKAGRLQQLESYFEAIPESFLDRQAWLHYSRARMYELSGRPQQAIHYAEKAHLLFREMGSRKGIGLCLTLSGYNHYQTGDFESAERLLMELLAKYEDDPAFAIQICSNLVFICAHLGNMSRSDIYYEKAAQLLPGLGRPDLAAFLNLNRGFRFGKAGAFTKALSIGLEIKQSFVRQQAFHFIPIGYHLISWSCYYLRRFQDGLTNAKKGLEAAVSKGFKDSAYGWLLMDAAMNAAALEDTDYAIARGLESLAHFEMLETFWGQAYVCQVLLVIYQKTDDIALAEHYGQTGLEIVKRFKLPIESGLLKTSLAALRMRENQLKSVPGLLNEAENELQTSVVFRASVHLCRAYYFWQAEKPDQAVDQISCLLQHAEFEEIEFSFDREREWLIPVLVYCYKQVRHRNRIVRLLQRWGTQALMDLAKLANENNSPIRTTVRDVLVTIKKGPPPPLTICFLGPFSVERGGVLIEATAWSSNKAKTIFQFLVLNRSKGQISKDLLMELLWPESSPQKAAHRLQVALSSLRKILEPENPEKTPSSYLVRQADSYRLDIGENGWVDCEAFTQEVEQAKATAPPEAHAHYLKAESLYKGDFLQEDVYGEWCREDRERYRKMYLLILDRLMRHLEDQHRYDDCSVFAEKYLTADPYEEGIYQKLMRCYAQTDKTGLVSATYQRCLANLKQGLDCEPTRTTHELFQHLTRQIEHH